MHTFWSIYALLFTLSKYVELINCIGNIYLILKTSRFKKVAIPNYIPKRHASGFQRLQMSTRFDIGH